MANIDYDYLSVIPQAMRATTKDNNGWIKAICSFPNGYESILDALDNYDVYGHNQLYSYFYYSLPMTSHTFNHLMSKDLNNQDFIAMYLFLTQKNSDYAHEFINKYRNITLTKEECSYVVTKIDRRNTQAVSDILDILLRSTTEFTRVYYLNIRNKELQQRVLNYMRDNVEDVFNRTPVNLWISIANTINRHYDIIDAFFSKHLDELINHYYGDNLLNLVNYLKPYPNASKLICEYVDTHFKEVVESYYKNIYGIASLTELDKSNVDYIYYLLSQIKDNEGVRFSDMTRSDSGYFSTVLILGDKVFKFGISRGVDEIIDSSYIIKPVARGKLETDHGNPFCYEITERAIPCEKDDVTEEEMYELYCNMRKEGIVWVDIRENNLGHLLKDNILHWNTPLSYDSESRGMIPNENEFTLKKGDLVIIDNDHRFREGEVPEQYQEPSWGPISYYQTFEKRYQKELKEQKLLQKK